mgnify:CR=1 FL=1
MNMKPHLTLALLLGAVPASASITYVDATTSNTTLADGSAYTPTASTNNTDDEWSSRSAFGNGGALYTANDNNADPGEDAPELRTLITGLTPGQMYEVYVYYWTAGNDAPGGNQQWDIQAGLTTGALTAILTADGTNLGHASTGVDPSTYFTNDSPQVIVSEGDRRMREYALGTIAADGSGNLAVYVDDNPGNVNRTWYDGVGYEQIPEPSAALLGGIGLLALLRRRRS